MNSSWDSKGRENWKPCDGIPREDVAWIIKNRGYDGPRAGIVQIRFDDGGATVRDNDCSLRIPSNRKSNRCEKCARRKENLDRLAREHTKKGGTFEEKEKKRVKYSMAKYLSAEENEWKYGQIEERVQMEAREFCGGNDRVSSTTISATFGTPAGTAPLSEELRRAIHFADQASSTVLTADQASSTVLTADQASSTVLTADQASSTGLTADQASSTGLTADQASSTGLTADQASSTGLTADQASSTVLTADQASSTGLTADQASSTGLTADQASSTGLTADQASSTGLTADQASSTVLTADQASSTGLTADQASSTGLTADQASSTVLTADQASSTGLTADQASSTGLTADQASSTVLTADQASSTGLTADQASSTGLTADQASLVDAAIGAADKKELLVEKFDIKLTRHDLNKLQNGEWLNDQVINFFFGLIMERSSTNGPPKVYAFSTFFYSCLVRGGYDAVKRWTKHVDIFSYDMLLVPIHLKAHWTLAVVDFRKLTIQYFDSLGKSNEGVLQTLRHYLFQEKANKRFENVEMSEWTLRQASEVPRQMNSFDCGVFVCIFAEYLSRDASLTFTQDDMPDFRQRITYEIFTKRLLHQGSAERLTDVVENDTNDAEASLTSCEKRVYTNRRTASVAKAEMLTQLEAAITSEKQEGLQIQFIAGKGRGIVTTNAFRKGDFVVEYKGEFIDSAEAKRREQLYEKDKRRGCYMYFFKHKERRYCASTQSLPSRNDKYNVSEGSGPTYVDIGDGIQWRIYFHEAHVRAKTLMKMAAFLEKTYADFRRIADEIEEQEWATLLNPTPWPGYICRVCKKSDHYIVNCPQAATQHKATPYQGPKRCYGQFACRECGHGWSSANSWANSSQSCRQCKARVYPFKQYPLNKIPAKKTAQKRHQ